MIIDDLADLFTKLHIYQSAKDIARHFDRDRKWLYMAKHGKSFTVNAEFVAGLNEYGYELKLVKKERD